MIAVEKMYEVSMIIENVVIYDRDGVFIYLW